MAKIVNYLGVDIGASGIKIAELKNEGGRARLVTYGFSEYGEDKATDALSDPEARGKELAELCKQAGATTKSAITGLPMASVFSTLFTFPEGTEKGLDEMIKSKVKKLSPISEQDLVIDWKKMAPQSSDKTVKVAVTAASREMINKYVRIFKASGLGLISLETEAYAMARSLLGKDLSPAIIIDFGSIKTNVLVVKEGVPVIHRTVKVGGRDASMILAEKMGVSMQEAEEIKKNLGANGEEKAAAVFEKIFSQIATEIKFCQSLYSDEYNTGSVEKAVLTGGSAFIAGFAEALRAASGLRVFLGDPWARVIYPDELRPALDKIGPACAIAVGLAMREILR